ncbi:glutamyl-tRNA amidotransferase [Endozoicomonas montiporae]|uniref:Aspartyl/glutamyl-tRNA(Asn/Gln) amidotransferase subunit C n=2 Tax=Endozoicomonas montiporae TaxID=1027273 RepID=A0A081N5D3_9GAMM|nr:Asp-tRNA(Asn)/Glu-tRNA(Gln) amidotransferase subunit GatC [Endozoicomonas montiporae]AMO57462.1 asparaginyl/glutamyl-tRNA amidotransferase subunit C [Endozoicomonas montiporae CL-33]KEQ13656.1 glutamyl-tRNA amidotransferase [Endozoicomonas montiporae]
MAIDASEIQKVAHLARLSIDDSQVEATAGTISNILDLVGQMQSVNTDNVEPMAHPLDATQRLREDVVTEPNNREKLQSVAPAVEDGLFLVPKVIE